MNSSAALAIVETPFLQQIIHTSCQRPPIGVRLVGRPIRAELTKADRELRRYVKSQLDEYKRIGYPTMATFARDIARGDIGVAPPTQEDPILEAVGGFFYSLLDIERRVISDKYTSGDTEYVRCRRVSQSVRQNRVMIERILLRLDGWLTGRGF